jgi:tRNA pseudouridine55 synthase
MNFSEGEVLLFDKPFRWTSFDLVKKVKRITGAKAGHAGTLDPLATGLMIICTGKKTKEISLYQNLEKEYTGSFYLGATTESFDMEKPVNQTFSIEHITAELISAAAQKFIGTISQKPPSHSAVKIEGKRAYDIARKGKEVDMKSREVTISSFEITSIELPLVFFRVVCSKGTYIRSLADDFGKELHSGAYLASLKRTRIGSFLLENALTLRLLSKFMP